MSPRPPKDDLIHRLKNVYRHLEDEGWYVKANTVAMAIEEIEKRGPGRPRTGFNKKEYDRERMRRIRADKKAGAEGK